MDGPTFEQPMKSAISTTQSEILSTCHQQGVLLVLSRPTCPRYEQEFHDWYDTEHGPTRLKLGEEFFTNGYRYKTRGHNPIWLAIYDMPKLSLATTQKYTSLRKYRSRREQEVFRKALTVLSRQFLRQTHVSGMDAGPATAITCVALNVHRESAKEVSQWYQKVSLPTPVLVDEITHRAEYFPRV